MIRSRRTFDGSVISAGTLRRQETRLILLNLAVLSGIAVVHALFAPVLGTPPHIFFWVLFGRMAMQTAELITLLAIRGPSEELFLRRYSHFSIWANLGFAFLLSRLAGFANSHYVVLMIIPVIAAAFRYRPLAISGVVGVAGGLTILEVALYTRTHPGAISEYFEAASVTLIYAVLAAVVASLARQIRSEQRALQSSLRILQTTRDQLVEEERLASIGRLASSIAHEIRNPVALIASSVSLGRKIESPAERRELDDIVEQAADSLERLTTDFLAYARQQPPRLKSSPVATSLGYVAELARPRAEEHSVLLRIVDEVDTFASFDPHQIHQALLNLVLNAIDASPAGGTVVLRAHSGKVGELDLSVQNSGSPIRAEALQRLFEPFFTTKAEGTGLGLAIARRIARAHSGDVVLETNDPGSIRFTIHLPDSLPTEVKGEPVGTRADR